jgi:isoquinoline 1-oxidoreductase subunit alpha
VKRLVAAITKAQPTVTTTNNDQEDGSRKSQPVDASKEFRNDQVERSADVLPHASERSSTAYEERGSNMVTVKINGQQRNWDGDPDLPLLWFLRDEAGLTGTKFGCGQALCGACTVIVDKQAVRACITSVSDVAGREVTTIEGLHPTGDHAVQKAWRQLNVPQCGYCQAGQIMQAAALLIENPKPNHDQIREAMAGNICRCGCYQRIENAVHLASTGV